MTARGGERSSRATSIADFHCHSTRSDGRLTPTELVQLAAARGVRILALTDHDTTAGLAEAALAAAAVPGFRLTPGVELACTRPGGELHMLGLFIDAANAPLQQQLARMRAGRIERGRRMMSALARAGVPVDWARVEAIAGEASVGRPHVARALVEAGHVASIEEAFDRFLAYGRPAYVERDQFAPAEAISLIRAAGGVAIFAHPTFGENYGAIATELAAAGLFGLEAFYRTDPPDKIAALVDLAERLGLIPTGGSDFHAFDRQDECLPGGIAFSEAAIARVLEAAHAAGCTLPEPAIGRPG